MNTRTLAAALAVFLTGGFGAHFDASGGEGTNTWHEDGAGCDGTNRLDKAQATCVSADWDNEGAGYSVTVQNRCASYGVVTVGVDVSGGTDVHMHIASANTGTYSSIASTKNVRSVHCCWNRSDLCFKSQVEKDANNEITQVTKDGASYTTTYVSVSTHQKRYDFCQANSDDIYCEVDPEGDANTAPADLSCVQTATCNCGDHHCTADDCDSEWSDNRFASDTVEYCKNVDDPNWTAVTHEHSGDVYGDTGTYSSSIDATDGTSQQCTITTGCRKGRVANKHPYYITNTITDDIDNLDDYVPCAGVLKTSCFD